MAHGTYVVYLLFNSEISFLYRVQGLFPEARLLALRQTLTIRKQCEDIGIWTQFCPACQFQERWTKREFLLLLLRKQVSCCEWMRGGASHHPHLSASVPACPKSLLVLDIFGQYHGYTLGYLCSWMRGGALLHPHRSASVPACPRRFCYWISLVNITGKPSTVGYLRSWTVKVQTQQSEVIELRQHWINNPAEIDDNLHKRISSADHSKMIKLFDMSESHLDGDCRTRIWQCSCERGKSWRTRASKGISVIYSKRSWMSMAAKGCLEVRPAGVGFQIG